MDKINLDDDGVFQCSVTVAQARAYFDGENLPKALETELDTAQGYVFSEKKKAYLIIEITPEG